MRNSLKRSEKQVSTFDTPHEISLRAVIRRILATNKQRGLAACGASLARSYKSSICSILEEHHCFVTIILLGFSFALYQSLRAL